PGCALVGEGGSQAWRGMRGCALSSKSARSSDVRFAKLLQQCPHLLSEQLQGFRRRRILNVVNAPIVRNMLPLREPLSHQWSMFCFFKRNHEVGARQVGSRTLQREAVGAPSSDFQLFERTQRNR